MAVIKIEAKKDTRCTQTVCLIQGDRRTQILRFSVNRYDGGVDLADLVWVIKTVNAKGVDDVFEPAAVEISESRITIDWLVDGTVTDASGMAKYELNGLDATVEGKAVIWKGGTGTMSLRANIGENFGNIDMTNIDRLVLYVEGRLQDIVDLTGELQGAGDAANAAAIAANAGAQRAEAAATAANAGATAATEAASNANAAADAANTAALPHAQLYGMRVRGETAKAAGNPVTFLPDAGSLIQPVTVLEPKQAGSGEPSPENIRPFIGYDKLGLNAAGKNLMPNSTPGTAVEHGVSFKMNEDGTVHVTGTNTNNGLFLYGAVLWTALLKPGTYTFSGIDGSAQDKFFIQLVRVSDGEPFVYITATAPNVSFTLTQETQIKMRFYVYDGAADINSTVKPLLELSSTPSAYASYQGKLHTVQIGQTVYGGKFDWLTGKFAKTHAPFMNYANMVYNSPNNAGDGSIFYAVGDFVRNEAVSSVLANSNANPWEALSVNTMRVDDGYFVVCVPNSITTSGELAAYMEGQMIVYKLATPVEIGPFTPHIISAADPEQTNTLYGDGRIDAEYVKPLHVSIEERVAAALAAAKE